MVKQISTYIRIIINNISVLHYVTIIINIINKIIIKCKTYYWVVYVELYYYEHY